MAATDLQEGGRVVPAGPLKGGAVGPIQSSRLLSTGELCQSGTGPPTRNGCIRLADVTPVAGQIVRLTGDWGEGMVGRRSRQIQKAGRGLPGWAAQGSRTWRGN